MTKLTDPRWFLSSLTITGLAACTDAETLTASQQLEACLIVADEVKAETAATDGSCTTDPLGFTCCGDCTIHPPYVEDPEATCNAVGSEPQSSDTIQIEEIARARWSGPGLDLLLITGCEQDDAGDCPATERFFYNTGADTYAYMISLVEAGPDEHGADDHTDVIFFDSSEAGPGSVIHTPEYARITPLVDNANVWHDPAAEVVTPSGEILFLPYQDDCFEVDEAEAPPSPDTCSGGQTFSCFIC